LITANKVKLIAMNILFIHSGSDVYGSGRILQFVVSIAKEQGHNCIVVFPEDGQLVKEMKDVGVKTICMELGILRKRYFTPWGVMNRVMFLFIAAFRLSRIIKKESITLVYSNTTAVLAGAISSFLTGKKHIWHVHEIIARPVPFALFLATLLRIFSSKVIVVSRAVYDHWNSLCDNKRITVIIYNGLDPSTFQHNQTKSLRNELKLPLDTILVGMVGRVHYWKGQDYFLEIARNIQQSHANVRFVMVGDPFPGYEYLLKKIQRMKKEFGLESVVYDLGFRSDIKDIMASLDIFVLPSVLPDPLPTVVLEAMFTGIPVVATSHGGATEMVTDGETGILIPWNNSELAYKKMAPLLKDSLLRTTMGKQARKRAEEYFSFNTFQANIQNLFKTI
jgi:glycosyltransferase involved in cell wall biosynthesis